MSIPATSLRRALVRSRQGAAGVDPKFVVLHQMWLGGGFGRRLEADMLVPAVQAAKAVGKPVKIIYSRENDMTMDFSRPLTSRRSGRS